MRLLICGDRNWTDYDLIVKSALAAQNPREYTTIISGGARGADSLAAKFALEFGMPLEVFRAEWDKWGKGAGPIRNHEMLTEGKPDLVLAFHDDIENSKGTKHMVAIARNAGVPVRIITH